MRPLPLACATDGHSLVGFLYSLSSLSSPRTLPPVCLLPSPGRLLSSRRGCVCCHVSLGGELEDKVGELLRRPDHSEDRFVRACACVCAVARGRFGPLSLKKGQFPSRESEVRQPRAPWYLSHPILPHPTRHAVRRAIAAGCAYYSCGSIGLCRRTTRCGLYP